MTCYSADGASQLVPHIFGAHETRENNSKSTKPWHISMNMHIYRWSEHFSKWNYSGWAGQIKFIGDFCSWWAYESKFLLCRWILFHWNCQKKIIEWLYLYYSNQPKTIRDVCIWWSDIWIIDMSGIYHRNNEFNLQLDWWLLPVHRENSHRFDGISKGMRNIVGFWATSDEIMVWLTQSSSI